MYIYNRSLAHCYNEQDFFFLMGYKMRDFGIWITWEKQRRNYGISKALGFKLYEFNYDDHSKIGRYILSIYQTIRVILKQRPKIVVAQNPSIILALLSVFLNKFIRYKLLIDSHNSGLFPMEGKNSFFMKLSLYIQNQTPLTIVTNEKLKRIVKNNGGNAFVLPDRIPDIPNIPTPQKHNIRKITCICTYGEDEPYLEIIKAAKLLSDDIMISFTGKYNNKVDNDMVPDNVELLGYISDEDYWILLNSSDLIVDLTLRENCLVCGAYEGIALNKPMVISNTNALKTYFFKGCTYVDPDYVSIASGIDKALMNLDRLKNEISELKEELNRNWMTNLHFLKKKIDSI